MNYRFLIGLLIGIGLLVVVFIAIFHHSSGDTAPAPNASARMVDFATTDTKIRFTNDFPVNADQIHHEYVTVVGKDQATFTIEQGYQGQILRSQTYNNNSAAYAEFLRALQLVGYTNGDPKSKLTDERGACPTGHRYIFEIVNGSQVTQRYWSTSCGNIGNFKGKTGAILDLFRRQVPDYDKLTSDILQ